MLKQLTTFKVFMTAMSTFLTVQVSDTPLRSLSYLSVFLVAGGNFWFELEDRVKQQFTRLNPGNDALQHT